MTETPDVFYFFGREIESFRYVDEGGEKLDAGRRCWLVLINVRSRNRRRV